MISGQVQFNTPPPPIMPNLSVPPPMTTMGPPPMGPPPSTSVPPPSQYFHQGFHNNRGGHRSFFQPFRPYPRPGPPGAGGLDEFDGKRLRKSVMRKTVDYNAAIIKMLEARVWQRDFRDRRALQPDVLYYPNMEPPSSYIDNPINAVVTRFVKTATNKMRCPIFCMAWTPEGRRLVTGASSGEFTLWNGLTFNFETILQAHDSPVRTMVWSHNDVWMVTGDHAGYVKYWQSNMNNVKMFQAHKEAIRGLSFSPTDQKFVTCSDDGTLRIWDFGRCFEEKILRGHGADVKCVHWHPQKSLIISGSKDNQQPIKLWDPKTGSSMATLHAHKSTVMDIKWNANGNWLVTASRDHLLKLFDIRNLSQEVQTFRGHKKEASSVAWHPFHEGLFCSGGSDGAILFWHVGADKEVGGIEQAHDSIVWTLAWHPMGHILCSGSNDHTSKFWTRNRPGDQMRDKYNLNTLPAGIAGMEDLDMDDTGIIPGMGPEDRVEQADLSPTTTPTIPGLDFEGVEDKNKAFQKKVPYSKPIPRNFVAQWNETGRNEDESESEDEDGSHNQTVDPTIAKMLAAFLEKTTVPGCIPVSEITPQAIIVYGKLLPVEEGDAFSTAIAAGSEALHELICSGTIQELEDVMPYLDDRSEFEYGEDNMDIDHMPDIELPPPLPSSIFAKKGGPVAQPIRKSRFSDAEPGQMNKGGMEGNAMGDQDMRSLANYHSTFPFSSGDQDLRTDPNFAQNQHDEDLRILRDIDLREAMMNSQHEQRGSFGGPGDSAFGGSVDGPFGVPGVGDTQLGSRDVDARHLPFNHEQGGWQQPSQQHWAGAGDPIRPGLNNFGTRNFVSSGNFQNQSGNFPNNSNDPPGNNYGNDMPGANFSRNTNASGNFGNANNDPGNNFDSGHQRNTDRDSYRDEDQFDGLWSGSNNQGPLLDRPQHGSRPQMGSGSNLGSRAMDPRHNMGPRQMGPNGPQMGQRPLGPHQQMGSRPQMGPGGPHMNLNQRPQMGQRGAMAPRGQPMGPRGPSMGAPQMGSRGQQMGQRSLLGPGGSQMGPSGPQMGPSGPQIGSGGLQIDHRRPQDPRNMQMDPRNSLLGPGGPQSGPNQQMGPGGPLMGSRSSHLGLQGPQMSNNQQMEPGGPQTGHGGPSMRQTQGGPPMGHDRGPQRGPMGPGALSGGSGGQYLDSRSQQMNKTHQMGHNQSLGPGGPHRSSMGSGGPQGNQRGPHMGPGNHQMDSSQLKLGPGGQQMEPYKHVGPASHQMEPNHQHLGPGGPHMGPSFRQMDQNPQHMGPGGPQMDSNQAGSDGSQMDSNQQLDDDETNSRDGGGYYHGRGFSRSHGPRIRMRGSRGISRGGWRGSSN